MPLSRFRLSTSIRIRSKFILPTFWNMRSDFFTMWHQNSGDFIMWHQNCEKVQIWIVGRLDSFLFRDSLALCYAYYGSMAFEMCRWSITILNIARSIWLNCAGCTCALNCLILIILNHLWEVVGRKENKKWASNWFVQMFSRRLKKHIYEYAYYVGLIKDGHIFHQSLREQVFYFWILAFSSRYLSKLLGPWIDDYTF